MFVAYVNQTEGCSHTIACGKVLWWLKATTRAEAMEELKRLVLGEWKSEYGEYDEGHWDEHRIRGIVLFEAISKDIMPLNAWYAEGQQRIDEATDGLVEATERLLLERLKAKYADRDERAGRVCGNT